MGKSASRMDAGRSLEIAARTGIDIRREGGVIAWAGPFGGCNKPRGPLAGKRIGVIVASEFSDFQAYYLVSYIGEHGGICEFLLVDWVTWKYSRPNIANKGVRGMWDLSVDPVPVMGGNKASFYKSLKKADPKDYDALVILGGHSADVMVTEAPVLDFIKTAAKKGAFIGGIGGGMLPMISAGIMQGKRCTGDRTVDYMLKKIGEFESLPVVTDGKILSARATVDTPAFLAALCRAFDPGFEDPWKGSLAGTSALLVIGEDFEDIELVVAVMELINRGAEVIIGKFTPELKSRPGLLGVDVVTGSFGVTIPFQEIPESYYSIRNLNDVKMTDFDVAILTGAFNPWNMVATGTTDWLKEAYAAGKFMAAICHGPIALSAADLVKGRKLTGWLASKEPVEIMGGEFKPKEWAAAIDGRIVSGRTPQEMPEFIDALTVAVLQS
ncbi:MAG: DJ-1/PfpI family protein [Spirochaetia bacterium]|jgi:putative intracellular protease/amidase